MKIFLTGGTGFIGKFVVNKLSDHKLLVLGSTKSKASINHPNITYLQGNLNNLDLWKDKVKAFKPDGAIHIAWEGIPDYGIKQSLKNFGYGINLYKFLTAIGCKKILSTGSCWEYGGQEGKLTEETLHKPFNAFTAAKNALFLLGQEIAKEKQINFIWTRLFYVYGPGQRRKSLIPYIIDCIKNNKLPELKNPSAENDFIYVEDAAEAISKLILSYDRSGVFNIGSGKLSKVAGIVKIVLDYFKVDQKIKETKASQIDSLSSFYADISKIKKAVGWKPKTSIEQGILKTIQFTP